MKAFQSSQRPTCRAGFSLIELLCVMGIIGILMSLMAPGALKALKKARSLRHENDVPVLVNQIAQQVQKHITPTSTYQFDTPKSLIEGLSIPTDAARLLRSSRVTYSRLRHTDPPDTVVFVVKDYPRPGSSMSVTKALLLTSRPPY